ncbi:MAG: hypothetical protein PHX49_07980 [Bacteroidales bacterium]|nr:hypothetical protein [Bacteroidales bacterium]
MRLLSIYILLLAALCSTTASAQSKKDSTRLSREMTLEKDFDPIFRDAGKINSLPTVTEPKVTKSAIEYSSFSIPVRPKGEFPVLSPIAPRDNTAGNEKGFVRLGAGNYLNTVVQAGYSILSTSTDNLYIGLDHTSTYGNVHLEKSDKESKMKLNKEELSLDYKHQFKALELKVDGGFMNRGFNYFGENYYRDANIDAENHLNQLQQGFDMNIGVRSSIAPEGFNYYLRTGYNAFWNKFDVNRADGLKENHFRTEGGIFSFFQENTIIGIDGAMSNYLYGNHSVGNTTLFGTKDFNDYTLLHMNPYIEIKKENARLRAGINTFYSFNKEEKALVTPDIEGELELLKQVQLYAFMKGQVNEHSLAAISRENLYVSPDIRIQDSRTQFHGELGFKITPFNGFYIQPLIGYESINNQHYYALNLKNSLSLNTGVSEQYPVYADLKNLYWGGTVRYQYQKMIDLSATFIQNNEKTELTDDAMLYRSGAIIEESKPFNSPASELTLSVSTQIVPKLDLSIDYYLGAGREALVLNGGSTKFVAEEMEDINELNLNASYALLDKLSIWGEVNNILNRKYEIFQGYPTQGIRFMLGASYRF